METAEEYKKRLSSYLSDSDPLQILRSTSGELKKLLQSTNREQWQKPSQTGGWIAAQILAHFAEGEIGFSFRLRIIASTNRTPVQAYDQNAWIANAGYLVNDTERAWNLFAALRDNNLALLENLRPEAWDHYGIHEERGKESIRDLVRLTAGHDLNHLMQIKSLIL